MPFLDFRLLRPVPDFLAAQSISACPMVHFRLRYPLEPALLAGLNPTLKSGFPTRYGRAARR